MAGAKTAPGLLAPVLAKRRQKHPCSQGSSPPVPIVGRIANIRDAFCGRSDRAKRQTGLTGRATHVDMTI